MDSKSSGTLYKSHSAKAVLTRRRSRRRKRGIVNTPGLFKTTLSIETQKQLNCIVSEDVSIEKPTVYVKKELFEEDVHRYEESSELHKFKAEIQEYPLEDILVYYVNDAVKNQDYFYICLSIEAKETLESHFAKLKQEQEMSLKNCVEKASKPWTSQGSEEDVIGEMNLNNRPLYEVEIETRYPIITNRVKLKLRYVNDARDGYVELITKSGAIIQKKCISSSVQVKPTTIDNVAQTICTYPKNAWTQYEYTFDVDPRPSEEFKKTLRLFVENQLQEFDDKLRVNSFINIYSDDYIKLVKDKLYVKTPLQIAIKEYMSFTDIDVCKNKMISSLSWHHFWSGVLIASYMDHPLNIYVSNPIHTDEINRIIFGVNPVLIWSFADALHPRLYLDTKREVACTSCCPFDENIVIGGLTNGQIVIWDIRNKLNHVEEEEILTPVQAKYRKLLFLLMGWMMNIKNVAFVRTTAHSDLLYSHKDAVTHIEWLSPSHEITRTGHLQVLPDKYPHSHSMQFCTSSLDGSLLFWDLHSKPITSGEYRSERKMRRLKKKPSALSVDVSPYRIFNRALRPTYKVEFLKPNAPIILPITCFSLPHINIDYTLISQVFGKPENERALYQPQIVEGDIQETLVAGTCTGYVIDGYWEGFEYSSSSLLNQETCKYNKLVDYHDGHLVNIEIYRPDKRIYLTVGGKIFAIWHKDFGDKPIIWRKSKHFYTHGTWALRSLHMIRLTRTDGCVELWDLLVKSNNYVAEQTISGQMLLNSLSQAMSPSTPVVGISDHNGSYRMYDFPETLICGNEALYKKMSNFITKEGQRKTNVQKWENEWKEKQKIVQKQEEPVQLEAPQEQSAPIEKPKVVEEVEKQISKKLRKEIPPGEYKQFVYEKWLEHEKERMNNVLLSLKHLNPEIVKKQQIPLKKIEKEKELKKKKQRTRLQNADRIFKENVDMNFPNALQKLPPPPLDPYAGGDSQEAKDQCIKLFKLTSETSNDYIKKHPFRYLFDWGQVIKQGSDRREVLDKPYGISTHRDRLAIKTSGESEESKFLTASKVIYEESEYDGEGDDEEDG